MIGVTAGAISVTAVVLRLLKNLTEKEIAEWYREEGLKPPNFHAYAREDEPLYTPPRQLPPKDLYS